MNSNLINILSARSVADVESSRTTTKNTGHKKADHHHTDAKKFKDAIDAATRAESTRTAKKASAQVEQSRDAKQRAQQKHIEKSPKKSELSHENSHPKVAPHAKRTAPDKKTNETLESNSTELKNLAADSRERKGIDSTQPAPDESNQQTNLEGSQSTQQEVESELAGDAQLQADINLCWQADVSESQDVEISGEKPGSPEGAEPDSQTMDLLLESAGQMTADKLQNNVVAKSNDDALTATTETDKTQIKNLLNLDDKDASLDMSLDVNSKELTLDAEYEYQTDVELLQSDKTDGNLVQTSFLNAQSAFAPVVQSPDSMNPEKQGDGKQTVLPQALGESLAGKQLGNVPSDQNNLVGSAKGEQSSDDQSPVDQRAEFKSLLSELKLTDSPQKGALESALNEPKQTSEPAKPFAASFTHFGLNSLQSSDANARGFMVRAPVDVPLGQPQWSQAVGDKVLWLAAQNVTSAELHLNPEDLGPLQVKVTLSQDQSTQVSFTSHHAQVREVLDQNIQRLKEMFAEQGMHSVQVDVSDRSHHRDTQEQRPKFASSNTGQVEDEEVVAISMVQTRRLVDHYV